MRCSSPAQRGRAGIAAPTQTGARRALRRPKAPIGVQTREREPTIETRAARVPTRARLGEHFDKVFSIWVRDRVRHSLLHCAP